MSQTIVFPGTFDPITLGHQDIIQRAATLFSQVIVAIAASEHKKPLFDLRQRLELAQTSLVAIPNVSVKTFDGLLINFVEEQQAQLILRGVRSVSDFEYELQLASLNKQLAPSIETLFLAPDTKYTHVCSRLIRDIAQHHGDVSKFVHPQVKKALEECFN